MRLWVPETLKSEFSWSYLDTIILCKGLIVWFATKLRPPPTHHPNIVPNVALCWFPKEEQIPASSKLSSSGKYIGNAFIITFRKIGGGGGRGAR